MKTYQVFSSNSVEKSTITADYIKHFVEDGGDVVKFYKYPQDERPTTEPILVGIAHKPALVKEV